jgi:hypothetical protein
MTRKPGGENLDDLCDNTSMHSPIRILLDRLIDYAGLFPPAGSSMADAVANYAAYREGGDAFALGRFILPATRLDELVVARKDVVGFWSLSVLIGPSLDDDFAGLAAFAAEHLDLGRVESIEVRASTTADVERIAQLAVGREAFVEIAPDATTLLDDIARLGLRAKIRTGGVTAEAFPSAEAIAGFIKACAKRGVAFKATAGLHHPIRCVRPLTYEANAPTGMMHGFVNLFLASAVVLSPGAAPVDGGRGARSPVELLNESDPAAFTISDDAIVWRGHRISIETLKTMRETLALSFGSCSFEEPLADLRELGWL